MVGLIPDTNAALATACEDVGPVINKNTPIKQEFINYLDFWMDQMIFGRPRKVFPEISIDNIPDKSGLMGSMYLSRILYGASKACGALKTRKYKELYPMGFFIFEKSLPFLRNCSSGHQC